MTPVIVDRRAPWAVSLIVAGTLLTSAVRGLGDSRYGPVPALASFDAIKFLDPVLLGGLCLLALLETARRRTTELPAWKVRWGFCIAVVFLIGVMSALFWTVRPYDAAQSILFALRPALLLLLFTAFAWKKDAVSRRPVAHLAVVAFAAANLALVAWEWLTLGAGTPDAIIGLFHDAHQQATFSYTVALLSIVCAGAAPTWPRRLTWGAFIAANALGGYVSQAQKTTAVEVTVVVGALLVLVLRSRKRVRLVARLVPVAALTAVLAFALVAGSTAWTRAAELVTGNFANRLDYGGYRGLSFLDDLGVVRMARDFWSLSEASPAVVLIGLGPANYGSPAAMRRVEQGQASRSVRELFWWEAMKEAELVEAGELRLLGLSAKTSLPGIILGEYGCVALMAYIVLVLWPLFLAPPEGRDRWSRRALFWVKAAYVGVVVQATLNTLGAWDHDVVLTLLVAGFASVLAVPGPQKAT